ncbi:accessory gene regulator ArgB-like protein [Enterococcus faecalis]|uniref:accessory gene regulator ArgB-like protein n=1 Tax=Enterococcus faecalis TaxID=1351 RepID=UPI001B0A6535|nr:accessory gene regulator B family protein [Enterococcus faecalis]
MQKFTRIIANTLVKEKIIDLDEVDIYIYGLETLFQYLFIAFLILTLGTINHFLLETIFFTICFLTLRRYAGGLHLKNDHFCILFSLLLIQLMIILVKSDTVSINILEFLACVSYIYIYLSNPIDNKNKPLDNEELAYFKNKLKLSLYKYLFVFLFCVIFQFKLLIIMLSWSIVINALSLSLGKFFRNRKSKLFL